MAQYGEFIDTNDIDRIQAYTLFYTYFDNPEVSKIKDEGIYSIYAARVRTFLAREQRYLFVFIKKDNQVVGHREKLSNMYWDVLQTRELTDMYDVPVFKYEIKRTENYATPINVVDKKTDMFVYDCPNFGFQVRLLFGKNQSRVYQDRGNVGAAIETYNTVFVFNN